MEKCWRGVEGVLGSGASMLERWKILLKEDNRLGMDVSIGGLEQLGARMPMLTRDESGLGTSSSAQFHPGSSAVTRREHEPRLQRVEELSGVFAVL
jgi:hypothetical protein